MRRTTVMPPDDLARPYLRPPTERRRYAFVAIVAGDGTAAGEPAEKLLDETYARGILADSFSTDGGAP